MSSESSSSSYSEEYDWDHQKEMLKDQCEDLNDEYLRVSIPTAELTRLVNELTELFDEQVDHHDSLIERESDAQTRTNLIGSAVKQLTDTLDRLAAAIRDNPSVSRKLRYGSPDSEDSDYDTD